MQNRNKRVILAIVGLVAGWLAVSVGLHALRTPHPYKYTATDHSFTLTLPNKPKAPAADVLPPDQLPRGMHATDVVTFGESNEQTDLLEWRFDPGVSLDPARAMRGSAQGAAAAAGGRVLSYVPNTFEKYQSAAAILKTKDGVVFMRLVYNQPNMMAVLSTSKRDYERAVSSLTFRADMSS